MPRFPFQWPAEWIDPGLLSVLEGTVIDHCVFPESSHPVRDAASRAGIGTSAASAPPDGVRVLTDAVWPQVQPRAAGGTFTAGPTGAPWIDSNMYRARLARARNPESEVWLAYEPPARAAGLGPESYSVAAADAEAAGARWIVSLDAAWRREIAGASPSARDRWTRVTSTLRFFQDHQEWRAWRPKASVGIISDFAGDNQFLGEEVLNLASRRNLFYRLIMQAGAETADLAGLAGLLYLDSDPPGAALAEKITAFVRRGGTLIAPAPAAALIPGGAGAECPVIGYSLRKVGSGHVAHPLIAWDDPYQIAADVHSLVGRAHDPLRLYNVRSGGAAYAISPEGAELLHLLNYSGRLPADGVSLGLADARSARMYVPEQAGPVELEPIRREFAVDFDLPPFSTYAGILIERQRI